MFGGLTSELLEGADGLLDFLKKDMLGLPTDGMPGIPVTPVPEDEVSQNAAPEAPAIQTRIYRFDHLDQVTDAAKVTSHICQAPNILYKKPGTAQYYLVLSSQDTEPLAFSRLCNILAEYGEKVKQEAASEAYYREHYEVIIRSQALQKLSLV